MKKRLIATAVIAFGVLLTACGQVPNEQKASIQTTHVPVRNIGNISRTITVNSKDGTQNNGIAQITMLSPEGNFYQYAVPSSDGNIHATLTVPWNGKTSISVTDGSKTLEIIDATVLGPSPSDQSIDLLPSYLADSNISAVSGQAHVIASSVTIQGMARKQAISTATLQWVKQHMRNANQTQTARADQTLASGSGSQASRTDLVIAFLRANNIPAIAVQRQVAQGGFYTTSYSIDAWIGGKWTNVGTP